MKEWSLKGEGGEEKCFFYIFYLCAFIFHLLCFCAISTFSLLTASFFHLSFCFVTLSCNSSSGGFPQATLHLSRKFCSLSLASLLFDSLFLYVSYIYFSSSSALFLSCWLVGFFLTLDFSSFGGLFFPRIFMMSLSCCSHRISAGQSAKLIRECCFFNPGIIDRRFWYALTEWELVKNLKIN